MLLKSIKDFNYSKTVAYLQENCNKFVEYAVRI